ncbi:hypothetical protein K2173_004593 [Erythroxylum novogranatense]|uniref:Protein DETOXIFICATION n=1 Tax=Erythroxylum novogranatense TaxID=1862640 RepID=A0AAV8T4T2_9ROSI|nr:hypothetical protein K2173_004593 [Erythroxylum novogranatense]
MERQGLLSETEERPWVLTKDAFLAELKKTGAMAVPMVAVSVSMYLLQVISLMMVGHLGQRALSGVAVASSFCNVTGISLLYGLAGALETLCGQAYGAEQYQNVGGYIYSAIISLFPICFMISILWIFIDKLLILFDQDLHIAIVAREYAICMLPVLYCAAILHPLVRYFLIQGLILPMLSITLVAICFHMPISWTLIYKWELGVKGAAFANDVSDWLIVILLALYMRYSSSCEKTRSPCWGNCVSSVKEFFRFAIPSAVMICLEWWTFEILIFLSGLLPDSELQTSVLSICLSTTSVHYMIQNGIGAAASARVSNDLGAGNPWSAKTVVIVVLVVSLTEAAIVSIVLFLCRNVFGYAYSNDKGVVSYVSQLAPLLSYSIVVDSLLAVLAGIVRGCGWQHIGAFINVGAYYLVGLPLSVVLAFVLQLGVKGLWIGVLVGSTVQLIVLSGIIALTNWQTQSTNARKRIFEGATLN